MSYSEVFQSLRGSLGGQFYLDAYYSQNNKVVPGHKGTDECEAILLYLMALNGLDIIIPYCTGMIRI